jgi:hypothetical protein
MRGEKNKEKLFNRYMNRQVALTLLRIVLIFTVSLASTIIVLSEEETTVMQGAVGSANRDSSRSRWKFCSI